MVFFVETEAVGQGDEKDETLSRERTLGLNNCNSTVFLNVLGIALDIPQVLFVEWD